MSPTEELFLVAAVWTLIAVFVARFFSTWLARIVFVAIAVAVPFWELPYGYLNFRKVCADQVQLQVFEKILPQESVCLSRFDSGQYAQLNRAGFSRIEVPAITEGAKEFISSGRVINIAATGAQSTYCITFENNILVSNRLSRSDILVTRRADGRIAARQSDFFWGGMWWQEMARPLLGRGGECSVGLNEAIGALRRGAG